MAYTGDTNFDSKHSDGEFVDKSPAMVASGTIVSDDPAVRNFYGDAISEAYRMKSELVAEHLSNIGMGK